MPAGSVGSAAPAGSAIARGAVPVATGSSTSSPANSTRTSPDPGDVPLGEPQAGDRPGLWRGQLGLALVGEDLDQGLVTGHGVALVDQPFDDLRGLQTLADVGQPEHGHQHTARTARSAAATTRSTSGT